MTANESIQSEEHEVDRLADLGVPEKAIAELRVEDLKMRNYRLGWSHKTDAQMVHRYRKNKSRRLARVMAIAPVTGMTRKECMEAVGYNPKQIAHSGIVASATNSTAYLEELAKHGIGPKRIAEIIADGIDAKVPLIKGGKPVLDENGEAVMVTNHEIRLKYVDRSLDITGAKFAPKKAEEAPVSIAFIKVIKLAEKLTPEQQQAVAEGDFSAFEEVSAESSVKDD